MTSDDGRIRKDPAAFGKALDDATAHDAAIKAEVKAKLQAQLDEGVRQLWRLAQQHVLTWPELKDDGG